MRRFGPGAEELSEFSSEPEEIRENLSGMPEELEEGGQDLLALYLEELKSVPELTEEEEAHLLPLASAGDRAAVDRLTEGCLMQAMRLLKPSIGGPVDAMELIGTANLALVKAVKRHIGYGENSGRRLRDTVEEVVSSELSEAVRAEKAGIEENRKIAERMNYMTEVSRVLAEQLGREPTEEEIAERMRVPAEEVRSLLRQAMSAL